MERPHSKRTQITERTPASSFEQEIRDLLDSRLRLVCATAFVISAASSVFYHFVLGAEPMVDTPLAPWMHQIYLSYSVLFGLALAIILARRWGRGPLLVIDYAVFTLAFLITSLTAAVFQPQYVPVFAAALLLFIHAAFLPVPLANQVGLAVTMAVSYLLAEVTAYWAFSGLREFWANPSLTEVLALDPGASAFRSVVLDGTFQLSLLGATSVLVTKALYNMRQKLHEARRMGNYMIVRRIGEGGMGEVYMAEHALMCRPTAVKVLKTGGGEQAVALARFEREVRLSATLTHPNTITIYDFGHTDNGAFYYAMEYLHGMDLQTTVERFGPIEAERVVYILDQICGALAEAHASGIVHRDIKPSNIFLTNRGGLYDFVKVLDFGLAKQTKADETMAALSQTGIIFGTPLYIAPEMAYGTDSIDGRTDLYSLGGVTFWMLTGRPPFPASSGMQAIIDNVKKEPEPPSSVSELPIPEWLDRIVMKLLAKKPEDRFQTAEDLRAAMLEAQIGSAWTQQRAREWWNLYAPEEEEAPELAPEVGRAASSF